MTLPLLKLGDVFRLGGSEYVYLAGTTETIYAAKIITAEQYRELKKIDEKYTKQGRIDNSDVFCYVALTTKEFEDRAVYLHNPLTSGVNPPYLKLSDQDIALIRREINDGPVSPALKKAVAASLGEVE